MDLVKQNINYFLKVESLSKTFYKKRLFSYKDKEPVTAVDRVNLILDKGDILGLIGESGCGKSTFGRLILGLLPHTSGKVILDKIDISTAGLKEMKIIRKESRMIFQSLDAALNPFMRIKQIIDEPLKLYTVMPKAEREKKIIELLERVSLSKKCLNEFPSSLSGGQKRRLSIARALAVTPKFIIADEPVSALDFSIRSQIIKLFKELHDEYKITMVFISHDISILPEICNKIAVMHKGKIVEQGSTDYFFTHRYSHEYTQRLMSSILQLPD